MSISLDSNKKTGENQEGGFPDAAKISSDMWHLSEGAKKKNIWAFKKTVNHALNARHLHFK